MPEAPPLALLLKDSTVNPERERILAAILNKGMHP
jgi:hypothetical protein